MQPTNCATILYRPFPRPLWEKPSKKPYVFLLKSRTEKASALKCQAWETLTVWINFRSNTLRFYLFIYLFLNQAAIQVSGDSLTLAYTSKSFQWHLQLHSCFTGMLQALHTAAGGKAALTPGAPYPWHFFSTIFTTASVSAGGSWLIITLTYTAITPFNSHFKHPLHHPIVNATTPHLCLLLVQKLIS